MADIPTEPVISARTRIRLILRNPVSVSVAVIGIVMTSLMAYNALWRPYLFHYLLWDFVGFCIAAPSLIYLNLGASLRGYRNTWRAYAVHDTRNARIRFNKKAWMKRYRSSLIDKLTPCARVGVRLALKDFEATYHPQLSKRRRRRAFALFDF